VLLFLKGFQHFSYKQGKLEEAIAELEIAVRLDPSNTQFRENLKSLKNKKKGF
jgi:TPR repeat